MRLWHLIVAASVFLTVLAVWSRFIAAGSPGPGLLKSGFNALTRLVSGEEGN